MSQSPYLSIVSPIYFAEATLEALYRRLVTTLEDSITSNFEIILVEDDSPDRSWAIIQELAKRDSRVRGIKLSRNFGQYYALTAGLDAVRGEWCVILDCDLQDRPEEIPNLHAEAKSGFDIVLARRSNRQDSWAKRAMSKSFYTVFSYLTDAHQESETAQFGIYHRKTVETLISMRERLRFLPAMVQWIGFRASSVDVIHAERPHGKSSYNLHKLLNLAVDTMIAFSERPLRLTVKLGLIISVLAFLFALWIVIDALDGGPTIMGWPSLMVSIWFFSGLIIFILGIIGLYIARIFEEVKRRPLYIIQERCGEAV